MSIRVFSTDTDAGCVSVIEQTPDKKHQLVCQIPVGNAPRGSVRFTTDGRGYVSNCGGNTISEINGVTNREAARITVGIAPRGIGIVPGDTFALVSNSGSDCVSVVDLTARSEIAQIAVGRDPRHMALAPDGRFAYVAVWGSHYVSKIDTSPLLENRRSDIKTDVREVARIPVGKDAHPYSVAIDPAGERAYVANTQAAYISVIDLSTDKVIQQVDVGSKGARAIAIQPDGARAYASVEDTSEVVAFETANGDVVRRFDVGPGPRGIAIDPQSGVLFSSSFSRSKAKTMLSGRLFSPNALTILDLTSMRDIKSDDPQVDEIRVGTGPCSVSILDLGGIVKK